LLARDVRAYVFAPLVYTFSGTGLAGSTLVCSLGADNSMGVLTNERCIATTPSWQPRPILLLLNPEILEYVACEQLLAGQEQRHSRPNATAQPPCESVKARAFHQLGKPNR
jgi:hypothetical protein